MTDYVAARKKLVSWIKQKLTGEHLKDNILISPNPLNIYTTGILYPIGTQLAQEEDDNCLDEDEKVSLQYQPPSSMGFSFYANTQLTSIRVFFSAVSFTKIQEKVTTRVRWKKDSLVQDMGEEVTFDLQASSQKKVMGNRAKIDVTIRPKGEGRIITVTLTNISRRAKANEQNWIKQAENSLFEATLKCFVPRKTVLNYPRVNPSLLSEEEQELELRYKDELILAIGHGVAVDWSDQGETVEIFSDFMPTVEIPQVTANVAQNAPEVLSFNFLANIQHNKNVFTELNSFVSNYQDWIEEQQELANQETGLEQKTSHRIIDRMILAKKRMLSGLSVLKQDDNARIAFTMANRAMLMQMLLNGPDTHEKPYGWRPFQLAFILMTLESSIDEDSEDRDLVDLIWFPTGGGKTEAYLGLMAFMFVYRRLRFTSSGGGTTAIMRYTLRLLTSQQFVRACKVISALELLRRENTFLGTEPFTIGLWLGGESSPNTFLNAVEQKKKKNYSKFILQNCPWCSTKFNENNFIATEDNFHFHCTNKKCDFGQEEQNILPYNVVDEALYKKPPTLLIATVDKFARLPWEARATSFFGGNSYRPPELIIQDELHLISGALGSIVGIYEVGFETILTSRGVYPKFIASTATVRQAKEQVRGLFARNMAVFPPVGLRQSDSYFAKQIPLNEKPGRLYVGYMAFNRSKQNCLEDLSGVITAAPKILFNDDDLLKDAWWTQLVYHGSLKGVGNSRTNFQSGIPRVSERVTFAEFYKQLDKIEPGYYEKLIEDKSITQDSSSYSDHFNKKEKNNDVKDIYDQLYPTRKLNIKSLTSAQTAEENAKVFENLSVNFDHENDISAALATNMVSVGLDVSRLAIMIINGQPLTTAEYIQASSRVGRGKIPGIVFANYYKTQTRSLSHYENFRAYHRSFYRYVEPSSLTPFTEQVRNRALHASLVSAIRHGEHGLLKNESAERFDLNSSEINAIINKFKTRIKTALKASSHERNDTKRMLEETLRAIDKRSSEWTNEINITTNLRYKSSDKAANSLLCSFDSFHTKTGLWKTLNSMRNVEKTALLELKEGKNNGR